MLHSPGLYRAYRADELRVLARRAIQEGWQAYNRPGGHVDLVNPTNGAVVRTSTTAYMGRGMLAKKRAEFERAGLDLRPKSERRRILRASRLAPLVPAPAVIARQALTAGGHAGERGSEVPNMEQAHDGARGGSRAGELHARYRDGSTVFVSDETVTIAGTPVRFRRQASGTLVAWTPPASDTSDPERRTWSASPRTLGKQPRTEDEQRADLEKRVRAWIADGRPGRVPLHKADREQDVSKVNGAAPAAEDVPTLAVVPPAAATPAPAAVTPAPARPRSVVWTAARVDPAKFPIAVALDDLEQAVAPAVAALEAAGKVDAAALVLAELTKTPAEAELLRLWRELTTKPRLEHGPADD